MILITMKVITILIRIVGMYNNNSNSNNTNDSNTNNTTLCHAMTAIDHHKPEGKGTIPGKSPWMWRRACYDTV